MQLEKLGRWINVEIAPTESKHYWCIVRNNNSVYQALVLYAKSRWCISKSEVVMKWQDEQEGYFFTKERYEALMELVRASEETASYLSEETYEHGKPIHLNNVGAYSKLHRGIENALAKLKETEPGFQTFVK